MRRFTGLLVGLLLIAHTATGADSVASVPLFTLDETDTTVSVETRVLAVPCRLGGLGELMGSGKIVLSGDLEDISALEALNEAELLSSPRITVAFPPAPPKLAIRDGAFRREENPAKPATLADVYRRLDPAGPMPPDFAERSVIADFTTNNRGIIVSVRAEAVTADDYELDYRFQLKDERLHEFHERIRIPKGGSKLIALASTKKEVLLLVITAGSPSPADACQISLK